MTGAVIPGVQNEEAHLARVLLKNKLLKQEDFDRYLKFREKRDMSGKDYLGDILIKQGLITPEERDEYVEESTKHHLKFCDRMYETGFLTDEQRDLLMKEHKATGKDIVTLLAELGIMTRDTFARLFDKNKEVGIPRIGEWFVRKNKLTNDQVLAARDLQRVNTLIDYVIQNNLIKKEIMDKVLEKIGWREF